MVVRKYRDREQLRTLVPSLFSTLIVPVVQVDAVDQRLRGVRDRSDAGNGPGRVGGTPSSRRSVAVARRALADVYRHQALLATASLSPEIVRVRFTSVNGGLAET